MFNRLGKTESAEESGKRGGIAGLPPYVSYLFREIDEKNIDLGKNRSYVIDHILEYGDDRSVVWCMKTFNKEVIGEAVENSTFISPQTASLWVLVLDLREGSIRCLSDRSIRKAKSSS